MSILSLLVTLLVFCLIAGVVWWIITLIPLPAPFARIVQVVVALVFLLLLVGLLFGGISAPTLNIR